MRILICTKRDLQGALFLNQAIPALAGHDIAGVWLSDKTRGAEGEIEELAQLRFLERTLPIDLVFPLIDRLSREQRASARAATFQGLSELHDLDISVVDKVNGELTQARLRALNVDLVLVARFSHIFKADTLAIPRHGFLNIHPGHLPEYAGLYAPMRQVLDGRRHFGTSVHWITPGIDDGPLIEVVRQQVEPERCLLSQSGELYPVALPVVQQVLAACEAGQRPAGSQQDLTGRKYRSMPGSADFEHFSQTGMRLWDPDAYLHELGSFLPADLALPDLAGLLPTPSTARSAR